MNNKMMKLKIANRAKKMLRRPRMRQELFNRCGEKAFLKPDELKFPIVNPLSSDCKPDCRMVHAAYTRAKQWHYDKIAKEAEKIYIDNDCEKKLGIKIHDVLTEAAALYEDTDVTEQPATGTPQGQFAYELLEHAKEEFKHFQQLWEFAERRGCIDKIQIAIDPNVIDMTYLNSLEEAYKKIQELELQAAEDYRCTAALARIHNDIEAESFFTELMNDELHHYQDNIDLYRTKYGRPCNPRFIYADNYHDELIYRLNKFIGDEISAAIGYTQLAHKLDLIEKK